MICSAEVSFGSRVRPCIFGKGLVARILFFMLKLRNLEYSAGLEVKRTFLSMLRKRLLRAAQFVTMSRLLENCFCSSAVRMGGCDGYAICVYAFC